MHPPVSRHRVSRRSAIRFPLAGFLDGLRAGPLAGLLAICAAGCSQDPAQHAEAAIWKSAPVADTSGSASAHALVALPDSSVVAVWKRASGARGWTEAIAGTRFDARGGRIGEFTEQAPDGARIGRIAAAAFPEGDGIALAWEELGIPAGGARLRIVRRGAAFTGSGPSALTPQFVETGSGLAVLALPGRNVLAAMTFYTPRRGSTLWMARIGEADAVVRENVLHMDDPQLRTLDAPALVPGPGGGWTLLWREVALDGSATLVAQAFGADGVTLGPGHRNAIENPLCGDAGGGWKVLPYPGDRVLAVRHPFGEARCAMILDRGGAWLGRPAEADSATDYEDFNALPWWTFIAPIDAGAGHYFTVLAHRLAFVDSTLAVRSVRRFPGTATSVVAAAVTAAGRPALLTSDDGGIRLVLLDRFGP